MITKKQIEKAVHEANLLQWTENEILEFCNASFVNKNLIETAERIIKKVREYEK